MTGWGRVLWWITFWIYIGIAWGSVSWVIGYVADWKGSHR